jgi:hypothetical protein
LQKLRKRLAKPRGFCGSPANVPRNCEGFAEVPQTSRKTAGKYYYFIAPVKTILIGYYQLLNLLMKNYFKNNLKK